MGTITLKQAALWCGGTLAPEYENRSFCGVNFDSRALQPGELFVAVIGARDGHAFAPLAMQKGAAAVLASRRLPDDIPAIYVKDTVQAMQTLARAWREQLRLHCVGITGSVGKTTTKEMVAAVLATSFRTQYTQKNFNNEMGLPVTVLGLREDCEAAVLEMGMNHFGEISRLTAIAQPEIALITNVGTMHVEYLGSREGILRAKLEILEGLRPGGVAIFNGDNDLLSTVAERYGAITFGFGEKNQVRGSELVQTEAGIAFQVQAGGERFALQLPVQGEHNAYNALAATAVALRLGVKIEQIQAALAAFENTGMRQKCYPLGPWQIIEDCYNAGPESMTAALRVLAGAKGRKIAVLGGMLELGAHAPQAHFEIGQRAAQTAQMLFAYGTNSEDYLCGAQAAGMQQAWRFDSHEALAQALLERLQPGDTILLKGSRGMKMEQVLPILKRNIGGYEHG